MNVKNLVEKKLHESFSQDQRLLSPKKIYLPNTGVNYSCNPRFLPVFLEPVDQQSLPDFRKKLEEKLREIGNITFWTYEKQDRDFKGVIDLLRARLKQPLQNPQEVVVAYHTQSDDPFLQRFLPSATELFTLTRTWNPEQGSLDELESKIDKHLRSNFEISYEQYKQADLSKLKGTYPRRPRHEAKIDFFNSSLIYLGTLAALNMNSDEYFSRLQRIIVSPIKRTLEQPLFEFIKDRLE